MAQKGYIKNSTTADLGAPELAAIFKGILPNSGIVDIFDDLACARVNDNLVRLSPGVYNLSGYILGVAQGTTADLAVDSGTAGYNRIDLLIAEFVRNGGGAGIDTLAFRILKGTSTTGTAVAPTLTQEDINGLGTTRQEALYRLNITGTTLAAPVLLADVVSVGQEFETLATNIKMNGTQSLGALETVARADHVHPSDTSRAPLASPTFTGTPAAPTAAASTDTTQLATTAFVHNAIDSDLNVSGTAPKYACRAWVDFNGALAAASMIQGSGNVSSITDNGTGDYTINFLTALPDANYAVMASAGQSATASDASGSFLGVKLSGNVTTGAVTKTTSALRVLSRLGNATQALDYDLTELSVAIFR